MPHAAISILILTLDEEVNLPACLDSVQWSDDIVVLDSLSSDRTVEIARSRGARVYQRPFHDYAAQRNFGLCDISYRCNWVLMVDADERVPPELRDEIFEAVASAPGDVCLFMLRRKDHLFGRWIRRSSGYPTWFGRLARVGHVRVARPINEEYQTDGTVAFLREHLDHVPFNKGFSAWFCKHDRYSTMEAQLRFQNRGQRTYVRGLLGRDPVARRRALKAIAYSLPGRPVATFVALYFMRGGVVEGRAGLTFTLLRAYYEFMIDCKYRELIRRSQGHPI